MATTIRFKWKRGSFDKLRTEPGVRQDLQERAERVARAAGPGVEVLPVEEPRVRARVLVGPVTPAAARRVAPENLLVRALEAGRGN